MKIKELLTEMPMGRMQHGGPYDNAPKGYQIGNPVRGNMLSKGMKLAASYNQYNHGTDFVEVVGVTGNDTEYGEGGPKFDSVKEALQSHGVRSLKALEELDRQSDKDRGYGHHTYLCVKEIKPDGTEGESGCWYYLFEGRWARGSGAEKLSFRVLEPAPVEDEDSFEERPQQQQQQRRRPPRSANAFRDAMRRVSR